MIKSSKKSLLAVLAIMLVATFIIPFISIDVNAASTAANTTSGTIYLDDKAGLLTNDEAKDVLETLEQCSADSSCNIVVLTANQGLTDGSIENYARDYYKNTLENKAPVNHTVTCTVDIGTRKVNIHGFNVDGSMQTLNDNEATDIREAITSDLTDGKYAKAFKKYAKEASRIAGAIDENGKLTKAAFPWGKRIIISLVIAVILSVIICMILKKQLKTVEMKAGAADYIRPNSLNITQSRDNFLYSNVTKTAKPKNNSSGSSRGGGGGSSTGSF